MTDAKSIPQDALGPRTAKSGKVIGSEYVQVFQAYLASAVSLPCNEDGSLSISALADASGIPRQSFYKNPQLKSMVDDVRRSQVDSPKPASVADDNRPGARGDGVDNKKAKVLERRLNQLEQQNAALVAENAELRRQLKALRLQVGRDDMAIETGRRIPAPPGTHA